MRNIKLYAALLGLSLAACTNTEDIEKLDSYGTQSFVAEIAQPKVDSRIVVGDLVNGVYPLKWNKLDRIQLFNSDFRYIQFTYNGTEDTPQASFTGNVYSSFKLPFVYATCNLSLGSSGKNKGVVTSFNSSNLSLNNPLKYEVPMYGVLNENNSITFHPTTGMLDIKLEGKFGNYKKIISQEATEFKDLQGNIKYKEVSDEVKDEIYFISPNNLRGYAKLVDDPDGTKRLELLDDPDHQKQLKKSIKISVPRSKEAKDEMSCRFYMPVPAGEYEKFEIYQVRKITHLVYTPKANGPASKDTKERTVTTYQSVSNSVIKMNSGKIKIEKKHYDLAGIKSIKMSELKEVTPVK